MHQPSNRATVEFSEAGPVYRSRGSMAKMSKAVLRATHESTQQVLAQYEPYTNPEEYHPDRIKSFMNGLGLRSIDLMFLDNEQISNLSDTLLEKTGVAVPIRSEAEGFFHPVLDIAGVKTEHQAKHNNPPELTESWGVHEAAHASGLVLAELTLEPPMGYWLQSTRTGFHVFTKDRESYRGQRGYFLEEGFCELIRGLYVYSALKKPNGFAEKTAVDSFMDSLMKDGIICPPAKYFYKDEDGDVGMHGESFAGYALELLILENPALAEKVINARKSPQGLRDFYNTLEKTHPGILRELNHYSPTSEDCMEGLAIVKSVIEPGIEESYDPEKIAKLFGL